MRIRVRAGTVGAATAALILLAGQSGRLRVPTQYQPREQTGYQRAAALTRGAARRADVIVMGNSRVEFGIKEQELARHLRLPGLGGRPPMVANLAAPALTPANDLRLWRRICRGAPPPRARLAVLGVTPPDFIPNNPGADFAPRYLYDLSDAAWLARVGRLDEAAAVLTYRSFPLYARRAALTNLILRRPRPEPPLPPPGPGVDRFWLPRYPQWYRDYRIDPFQVRCLEQRVAQMQARGIRVVLVCVPVKISLLRIEAGLDPLKPVTRRSDWLRPQSPLSQFQTMMQQFARRAGVPYLNYAQPGYVTRFEYWDPGHLWPESALKFTRDLARDINRQFAAAGP